MIRDLPCHHWNGFRMTSIMPMWDYKLNKYVCSDSGLPIPGDTTILKFGQLTVPSDWAGKESACNVGGAGDAGLFPGLERWPGGGNDSPLQYSRLGNPMDRGAWWAKVQGILKNLTRPSDWARKHTAIPQWSLSAQVKERLLPLILN